MKSLSRVRLFATPWTVAYQAPPFMEFSKQEYWSGLSFPSPEEISGQGQNIAEQGIELNVNNELEALGVNPYGKWCVLRCGKTVLET